MLSDHLKGDTKRLSVMNKSVATPLPTLPINQPIEASTLAFEKPLGVSSPFLALNHPWQALTGLSHSLESLASLEGATLAKTLGFQLTPCLKPLDAVPLPCSQSKTFTRGFKRTLAKHWLKQAFGSQPEPLVLVHRLPPSVQRVPDEVPSLSIDELFELYTHLGNQLTTLYYQSYSCDDDASLLPDLMTYIETAYQTTNITHLYLETKAQHSSYLCTLAQTLMARFPNLTVHWLVVLDGFDPVQPANHPIQPSKQWLNAVKTFLALKMLQQQQPKAFSVGVQTQTHKLSSQALPLWSRFVAEVLRPDWYQLQWPNATLTPLDSPTVATLQQALSSISPTTLPQALLQQAQLAFLTHQATPTVATPLPACQAGALSVYLSPSGVLSPCQALAQQALTLNTASFGQPSIGLSQNALTQQLVGCSTPCLNCSDAFTQGLASLLTQKFTVVKALKAIGTPSAPLVDLSQALPDFLGQP
jgi:hypothetical protein